MNTEKELRSEQCHLFLTDQEKTAIMDRMKQTGITNLSAYIRKMAIDGYVMTLDVPELKEMISLLRYSSNNLNQIAKRANETGRVYAEDLAEIRRNQDKLWDGMNAILQKLGQME